MKILSICERITMCLFSLCFLGVIGAHGQTNKDYYEQFLKEFQQKDTSAVSNTISKWETAFPESAELVIARANVFLSKSAQEVIRTTVEPPKFDDGRCLVLKDSLGNVSGYMYSEFVFNEDYFQKWVTTLQNGIKKYPERIDLRSGLIYSYFQNSKFEQACAELLSLVYHSKEIDNKWFGLFDEPYDKATLYDCLQDYFTYFIDGRSDISYVKKYVDALIEVFKDNPVFYSDKAYVYMMEEDFDSAIKEYELAYTLDPSDMLIVMNLGYLYEQKGDKKKAIEYYKKVIDSPAEQYLKDMAQEGLNALK